MRKVSDYIKHAEECRRLAQSADAPEHKTALLAMAETWLELARARQQAIARKDRVAKLDVKSD